MTGFEIAAAAVVAAGALTSAQSALQSSKAQAAQARFNGELTAREAEISAMLRDREQAARGIQVLEEKEGLKLDLSTFDKGSERFRSRQLAVVGSSGFELSGSAIEVLADTAGEQALEREQIITASKRRERRIRDEGLLLGFEAARFREQGQTAREIAGFESRQIRAAGGLRAFSSLLGGASQIGFGLGG